MPEDSAQETPQNTNASEKEEEEEFNKDEIDDDNMGPPIVTVLPIPTVSTPRFIEKKPDRSRYSFSGNSSSSLKTHRASTSTTIRARPSTDSDTVAASSLLSKEGKDHTERDDQPVASGSALTITPTRVELNRVLGDDIIPATALEISSIPCAGVRVSHGPLKSLMAWRLIVQLDEPTRNIGNAPRQAVVCNFILDTGSNRQPVPAEVLQALNYKGQIKPGKEVTLTIQNIRTTCVVAQPGEAARLSALFTTAGNLTFYFDARLSAPVLFMGDQEHYSIKARDIPRTVSLSRNLSQRVMSMLFRRP